MTKEQFDERVLSLEQTLYNVSYNMLSSPHDRADAVQETIKKAMIKRESLRDDNFLKTWLIRILINECHNIQRMQKRIEPREYMEEPLPNTASRELLDALGQLDEKHRLPIVLHHISGYTTKEVAKILRIPEGTVKYRLVRGRETLQTILEEKET